MPPTAFVFDIGNVLLPFDMERATARILARCHHASGGRLQELQESKHALESGKIEAEAFFAAIREKLGYRGTTAELTAAWEDIFVPNKPMWDFVAAIAGRFPAYLLSNTNEPHVRHMFRSYPVFSHFDGAVYSHEAGCCKPDERIYRLAEERFDLIPQSTVYVDDLPENVATPRKLGWDALVYDHRNHGAFLELMRERGVL